MLTTDPLLFYRRVSTSRSVGQASVRELAGAAVAASVEDTGEHGRKVSFGRGQLCMALSERERLKTIVGSPHGSVFDDDGDGDENTAVGTEAGHGALPPHHPFPPGDEAEAPYTEDEHSQAGPPPPMWKRILVGCKEFVLSLATPPTISLATALVCALVTKLKCVRPSFRSPLWVSCRC